jgi:hypothetical protein
MHKFQCKFNIGPILLKVILNQASIIYRQVLAAKPVGTNDYPQLELPGVERPDCNSKPTEHSSSVQTRQIIFI